LPQTFSISSICAPSGVALWNALPGAEKRRKVGDREALIDQL
jgi:hypothetical protein